MEGTERKENDEAQWTDSEKTMLAAACLRTHSHSTVLRTVVTTFFQNASMFITILSMEQNS